DDRIAHDRAPEVRVVEADRLVFLDFAVRSIVRPAVRVFARERVHERMELSVHRGMRDEAEPERRETIRAKGPCTVEDEERDVDGRPLVHDAPERARTRLSLRRV